MGRICLARIYSNLCDQPLLMDLTECRLHMFRHQIKRLHLYFEQLELEVMSALLLK